MTAQSMSV